ncbi:MAG: primosomal protein N' [Nitrospira sp.]|nr:primosomal protein N' [Nitrospira sp.]MDE0486315.1 primosomal protein N' [Nitrospira sp.]
MPPSYADVVFPPRTSQAFTYRIPQSWNSQPKIGQWVLAPFGSRVKPGIIVSLDVNAKQPLVDPGRIRELYRVTSAHWEPDPKLVALAEWMTDYYLAPAGTCLALVQPPDVPFRSSTRWTITQQGQQRLETARTGTSTHTLLTALAKRSKGLAQSTIETLLDNPSTVLQRLKRNKWIQARQDWTELPVQSSPAPMSLAKDFLEASEEKTLDSRFRGNDGEGSGKVGGRGGKNKSRVGKNGTPVQGVPEAPEENPGLFSWRGRFRQHLAAQRFGEMLLTDLEDPQPLLGDVIQETMAQGRTILVIAPNINRATRLVSYLRYSVKQPIGEFHSGHSDKQRLQLWQAIKQGHYSVVVGTRSALFLPLPALGCVWVEREGDNAYKEDPSPHYHAREVARKKAELDDAVLVLHAPYPTLETVHRFAEDAPWAFAGKSTPKPVQVINLQDMAFGTMFSDALQNGMEQALKQGGGIVIYHNRKGFSSSITCRDCGTAPQCPRCRIPLGLRQSQLRCPYCGQTEPSPSACPACSSIRLEPVGFGTERLEEELRRLYPNAAIARYDGNTIRTEAVADRIREQFAQGRIHVVVGTELLFQASPFTPVRCVGIPYADAGLHVPDFRSSERVFHHLQRAVDLVTPGLSGSTIIQTRLPSHPVMHAIGQQQPDFFYDHELAFRRLVGYPPFGQLIQLHVSGQDATETENAAKTWRQHLTEQLAYMIVQGEIQRDEQDAILGPLAAYGAKPRGQCRYHLLVKIADGTAGRTLVRRTLESMTKGKTHRSLKFGGNVDPLDVT